MSFKYKKVHYENLYVWAQSDQGTCFYCKQDKPVEIEIYNGKGICKECLNDFEIGNVAADRHVIMHIIPEFDNCKEAVKWFEEKSVKMVFTEKVGDIYCFNAYTPEGLEFMEPSTPVQISGDGKSVHIVY